MKCECGSEGLPGLVMLRCGCSFVGIFCKRCMKRKKCAQTSRCVRKVVSLDQFRRSRTLKSVH